MVARTRRRRHCLRPPTYNWHTNFGHRLAPASPEDQKINNENAFAERRLPGIIRIIRERIPIALLQNMANTN